MGETSAGCIKYSVLTATGFEIRETPSIFSHLKFEISPYKQGRREGGPPPSEKGGPGSRGARQKKKEKKKKKKREKKRKKEKKEKKEKKRKKGKKKKEEKRNKKKRKKDKTQKNQIRSCLDLRSQVGALLRSNQHIDTVSNTNPFKDIVFYCIVLVFYNVRLINAMTVALNDNIRRIFSRVHATLHPALPSISWLVGRLVGPHFTFFINFISLSHFKSF